ncbi:hypothetical protein TNCV_1731711 [Trichonephila clavipes]|nr:hypothetical protein TNCV_1731711 [Trichonephila clavipes]
MEAKHVNEFRPNDVMWEKTSKGLLRKSRQTAQKYRHENGFTFTTTYFCQKDFTFGLRTVTSGEIHLIQTTHVPMLIYELPASSLKCRAHVIREVLSPMTKCSTIEPSWSPTRRIRSRLNTLHCVDLFKKPPLVWTLSPNPFCPSSLQKGFHGRFPENEKV